MTQPASDPRSLDSAPRWIDVALGGLRPGRPVALPVRGLEDLGGDRSRPWTELARFGGTGLGLALLERRPDALAVSIGECVRRGVPTAARATLAARSPLTGLLTEGQVGSDLGRRLVGLADALAISGRASGGDLLVIGAGALELRTLELPPDAPPAAVGRALRERLGDVTWLTVGPAGRDGHPLATLTVGDDTPHVVGRGGLGAVLGRTGLRAIVVTAPLARTEDDDDDAGELVRALLGSPRLASRARGGTFELFEARSASGALFARGGERSLASGAARAWARDAGAAARERHGCRGCPTPCGWRFERPAGEARPARFGATQALGPNLGLEELDDAFALLALCDDEGLDAKEVGGVLALAARARADGALGGGSLDGEATWGRFDRLADDVRALARRTGVGARLGRGVEVLARELGYADALVVKGQSVAPEPDDLALLALCVAWRGADPMRTFPFALASLTDERVAELVRPLPFAPRHGRLVWWHENLALALDATGFCSFSAAGLLADGVVDLDGLARWIAPASVRRSRSFEAAPGAHLLALGHALALGQRTLGARWLGQGERRDLAELDRPAWTGARLDPPELLAEYRALRGVGADGRVLPGAFEAALRLEGFDPSGGLAARPAATPGDERARSVEPSAPGTVAFRAGGPLGRLVDGVELRAELPAALDDVLRALARARPEAADWILRDDRLLPAVFREGRRLDARTPVVAGDRLELVLAIAGGSGLVGP